MSSSSSSSSSIESVSKIYFKTNALRRSKPIHFRNCFSGLRERRRKSIDLFLEKLNGVFEGNFEDYDSE